MSTSTATSSASRRPRVLAVDDEPLVLEGLQLHLRRGFELVTAGSGEEGLALVSEGPAFAVIMSDMRMPGMDGATFLARTRAMAPDSVRVLLTGHADFDAALAAVNEGQIFRFLTKPCPPDVVRATLIQGAEQHRLVHAERELLELTLSGAVRALAEVLAVASPVAFGRASRLHRTVSGLCDRLGVMQRWPIEVAARLSQLGVIHLPGPVAEKLYFGEALTPAEQAQADRLPALTDQLLGNIPRLEPVREILAAVGRPPAAGGGAAAGQEPIGARMLRLALELDALEARGLPSAEAVAVLQSRPSLHDRQLLETLAKDVGERTASSIQSLPVAQIKTGMVLADDVRSRTGVLLVARGHQVSAALLARLVNLAPTIKEPLRVVVPDAAAGP